jgi:hypothetical protein
MCRRLAAGSGLMWMEEAAQRSAHMYPRLAWEICYWPRERATAVKAFHVACGE